MIEADSNNRVTWQQITVAVLMDIRDELQQLNRTLGCSRVWRMADAMIALNNRVKGPRITTKQAARVLAKRGASRRKKVAA
jgi:hypothetical protein